jgi:hypothetical protein
VQVGEPSGIDAIGTFEDLRDAFLRYYDTPFGLADSRLQDERRALLDRDGGIYRRPLLELRPQYQTAGRQLAESAAVAGAPHELAGFGNAGLVPPGRELYTHQEAALRLGMTAGHNIVITAGTGSGKTESFLLPVLASLLEESRSWGGQPARAGYWWRGDGAFQSQRADETGRAAAVRAMVLYPMNALVDDQLIRMRKAFDSDAARGWLDQHRRGHRFYFGRYTGATPVTGGRDNAMAVGELRRYLQATDARGANARAMGGDTGYFVPRLDGAEMRSRWDMADAPPDILVTNYSMLNVMLLRERDSHFFADTAAWLRADDRHRFTLVIDELHTYRGTAGTEVALLLRNLLHRLGLSRRPQQLRLIAASASLEPERDREYLQEFFGVAADSFHFLAGDTVRPVAGTNISHLAPTLAIRPQAPLETDASIPAALWNAFYTAGDGTGLSHPEAKSESELIASLFPDAEPSDASAALTALLGAVARGGDDPRWPRLRTHLFFRNVAGMWACTDRACREVPEDLREGRTVGRIFAEPATRCGCGGRVLELLYCQNCGDVMLGGFVPTGSTQRGRVDVLMLADVPELAKLPDQVMLDRTAANYLMFWPRTDTPNSDTLRWAADRNQVSYEFRPSTLNPANGQLQNVAQHAEHAGWSFHVTSARNSRTGEPRRDPARLSPFPTQCPNCGDDWEIKYGPSGALPHTDPRRQRSPIRGMRTGFEKINQVLVTELAQQLQPDARKLIIFTDSRQDAAKLAAGMGLRHYQDLLRLLLVQALAASDSAPDSAAARRYVVGRDRTPETYAAVQRLKEKDRSRYEQLSDIWDGAPGTDPSREAQLIAELASPPNLDQLATTIETELLSLGVNPGGPQPSFDKTAAPRRGLEQRWTQLFDWSDPVQPRQDFGIAGQELIGRLDANLRQQLFEGLFSGAGRDFESLGLGWLALASDNQPDDASPASPTAIARASLRVLASLRRFETFRDARTEPPKKLRAFWTAAARHLSCTEAEIRARVLAEWGTAVRDYLIVAGAATLRRAPEKAWVCGNCRRQHLHFGCGICTRCHRELPAAPSAVTHEEDYYAWKAVNNLGRFRLNCAELTGQTDRLDAQSRQARFQEVFLDDRESPRADGVDLLSVTTTMEAGVDIGALEAVVLGNMPPTRFNYQQRVGRAGRRGSPVAVALTVCRGRSHDEYYFERPHLVTNEPTPKPYLTLDRDEIFYRALRSEVLRMAFRDITARLIQARVMTDATSNPHGQFGLAAEWPAARREVQDWLNSHASAIEAAAEALARHVPAGITRHDWPARVTAELVPAIDTVLAGTPTGHSELSQRLAEAGILPMFGFPTRVRYLHLNRPARSYPWPPQGVIDRDIAMAVSQFAPLGEVVRDGSVYPVVGVAAFRPLLGRRPLPEPDAMGIQRMVAVCRACSHIANTVAGDDAAPSPCPRCGAAPGTYQVLDVREPLGFRAGRSRDFDGNFSWSVRAMAARAMTDLDELRFVQHGSTAAYSGPGLRYVINDNAGNRFRFQEAAGTNDWGGFVSVDAIERELLSPSQATGDQFTVALGAVQPTDFLFLGPTEPVLAAAGIRLNLVTGTRQPYGVPEATEGRKAAWYSLAFLIRVVAATQLDVQQRELIAGIYSGLRERQPAIFAFIADTLENGAGFSTHLGEPEHLAGLLAATHQFLHILAEPGHARECTSSCYRCLRDYSNMAYHALLDWRLASDLFSLLQGQPLAPSRQREEATITAWARAYNAGTRLDHPAPFAVLDHPVHGLAVVIAKHPLEASERTLIAPRLAETLADAEAAVPDADAIVFADTFLLDRDPGRAIAMIDDASEQRP